ncbi:MAG: hypothetical protein HeimC2_36980 [Candidatus Heimdallarchaeota archaeon LC_2]|nr:MAG: hypothetical protein HeimC2_36980 [Candidatus Heimdallarchaeota archaeon LC_2]
MAVRELSNLQGSSMSTEHGLLKMNEPIGTVISTIDEENYQRYPLIYNYKYYIIQTYGISKWESLLEKKQFSRFFNHWIGTYGEAIFQGIINLTAEFFNIQIGEILHDFGEYLS